MRVECLAFELAVVLSVGAGLCLMVGASLWARRLLVVALAVLLGTPLLLRTLSCFSQTLLSPGPYPVMVLVGIIAALAWIRYINHRRQLGRWFKSHSSRPTSLKRRLERE